MEPLLKHQTFNRPAERLISDTAMAPTPVTYLQPLLPFIVFTCAITLASYYLLLSRRVPTGSGRRLAHCGIRVGRAAAPTSTPHRLLRTQRSWEGRWGLHFYHSQNSALNHGRRPWLVSVTSMRVLSVTGTGSHPQQVTEAGGGGHRTFTESLHCHYTFYPGLLNHLQILWDI